jgi:urease accessory protein
LTFALQGGETVLRDAYCETPFKITHVLNSNRPLAHLILMHSTAGLFGGDEVECSIRVQSGARVLLTQQSATKVHPSEGRPAIQRTHVVVERGAELQLYLEPVIPFAGSLLRQTTQIDVNPGGRLAFWEAFMTGRVGRGESWKFQELASETQLRLEDRLIYLDRFRLLPNGLEQSAWAMSNSTYVGTGLYVGEDAPRFAAGLHGAMPEAGIDSLTENVAIVRVTSTNGPDFHRCRESVQSAAGSF